MFAHHYISVLVNEIPEYCISSINSFQYFRTYSQLSQTLLDSNNYIPTFKITILWSCWAQWRQYNLTIYLPDVKKYKFIELEIKMPSLQWKWQVIHWFCFSDFQPYLQTISPFPDRFL